MGFNNNIFAARGQFHQPNGAKYKCASKHPLVVHQQNYGQLCKYNQLGCTLNFYAVFFMPCTSKIGIYLLG